MTLDERKDKFLREYIRDRTRDQLAHELFGIYLSCRANCAECTEDDDPWPVNAHLADVMDKYVIPSVIESEREE